MSLSIILIGLILLEFWVINRVIARAFILLIEQIAKNDVLKKR